MLNLKRISLKAEKKNEVENFAYFEEDDFFEKTIPFEFLYFSTGKKHRVKKYIFLNSRSRSIKSCKNRKKNFYLKFELLAP